MIIYSFFKQKEKVQKIIIKGHALYDKKNKDVVCASVSTAIIMTLNAIEIFGLNHKINYKLKTGYFLLEILIFDQNINYLLLNLEYNLKDLNENYSQYVKEEN
ncbi:ribosomal-processing cysteine protease Prp [Candidatus Phytoplasma pini]|uniref:Ribosomal processing cysteine protease Prp n=1 Tax=Candidatus Phytoplasma pini TaxID=267362 RepID=A0A559KJT5_9MOLU|nr:ribosomal-processing cysteine protease Prp [Candidatus Phytoplasma pini]TVY12394.1 hypothetical protein MDPP_007 [Candidatus Phytoplasma pini]